MKFSKRIARTLPLAALLPLAAMTLQGCLREPVAGTRLVVSNSPDNPERNSMLFWSNDSNIAVPDAEVTTFGGSIDLHNFETGEDDHYTLPAKNWQVVSTPHKGYRYLDFAQQDGPCQYVAVSEGQSLIALCRGAGMHFTLDEAQQHKLDINVDIGVPPFSSRPPQGVPVGVRYCAVFGGEVMRDTSTSTGTVGTFFAKDAPAPDSCW